MDVLDEQDRRPVGDDLGQKVCPGVLEAVARGERVKVAGDVETERKAENLSGAESVEREFGCIAFEEAQVLLQHLAERPVSGPGSVREAATGPAQWFGFLFGQQLPELTHESRFADACIA